MSDTTPQPVSNGCRKYVKSRIDFNNFNTFINVHLYEKTYYEEVIKKCQARIDAIEYVHEQTLKISNNE